MGIRKRLINRFRSVLRSVSPKARFGASGRLFNHRVLGEMPGIYQSPDSYLSGGIADWRAKARWQTLTNPYARQIQRTLSTNLIGPRGIQMRANVRMPAEPRPDNDPTPREQPKDPVRCQEIEKAWHRFITADCFDISGQRGFHQFELAIAESFPAAGGVLVRMHRETAGKSKTPICFELIPIDQLDESYTGQSDIPGRHWRMGIEFDTRTKRRTRYAVLKHHPGDNVGFKHPEPGNKYIFVKASDILHIYIPEDIGQTRERPWLLSVLTTIQNINSYEEAHWTRKKAINNMLGFIQKPEPDMPGSLDSTSGLASEYDQSTGEVISRSAPGQWVELLPGEVPIPPQFGADDQMFGTVLKTMLRRMAAGGGLSYQSVSKDFSDTNYSSSRLSELQDRDTWRTIQRQVIAMFHQRVFEEWLHTAMLSETLDNDMFIDYYDDPEKYCCPSWHPRTWSFIDPKKEMDAFSTARNLGLQSAGDQVAELFGTDLEQVWQQLSYEKKLAAELDLEFATMLPGQIPNRGMPVHPDKEDENEKDRKLQDENTEESNDEDDDPNDEVVDP